MSGQRGGGAAASQAAVATAAAAALALSAYGASARSAAPDRGGSPRSGAGIIDTTVVIVGLVAALLVAVLLVALLRGHGRRRSEDEHQVELPPFTRWSRPLAVLAIVVAFAIPVGVLIALRHAPSPAAGERASSAPSSPQSARHAGPDHATAPPVSAGIVAGVAAIAVVAAIVLWRGNPASGAAPPPAEPTRPDSARLARGITAAAAALRTADGGDRAAIVGCYAAMERALADAGAPRRPSDTPIELLGRASAAGLVPSAAAGELTRLFHEARYSPHPIGPSERERAQVALGRLTDELGAAR